MKTMKLFLVVQQFPVRKGGWTSSEGLCFIFENPLPERLRLTNTSDRCLAAALAYRRNTRTHLETKEPQRSRPGHMWIGLKLRRSHATRAPVRSLFRSSPRFVGTFFSFREEEGCCTPASIRPWYRSFPFKKLRLSIPTCRRKSYWRLSLRLWSYTYV